VPSREGSAEGERPELLVGFRVVVQPGGRAGTVRFLAHETPAFGGDGPRAVHIGPPVTLPAEPATTTSAACGRSTSTARRSAARSRLQRGKRTYTRKVTFRRAGKRELRLTPPRRTAMEDGLVTITARMGDVRTRVRLQSSY
jgi:hypothetical protein